MAAQAGRAMAVLFRATAAEAASTPAHLRVVASACEGGLALRIPKRRCPALAAPIRIAIAGRPRIAPLPSQETASQPSAASPEISRPLPRLAA
jgi:hypothetical protein